MFLEEIGVLSLAPKDVMISDVWLLWSLQNISSSTFRCRVTGYKLLTRSIYEFD